MRSVFKIACVNISVVRELVTAPKFLQRCVVLSATGNDIASSECKRDASIAILNQWAKHAEWTLRSNFLFRRLRIFRDDSIGSTQR